jgi:exodeoxyribonuclease VII large subunit
MRELKHTEEILLRSSPTRKLKETQTEFDRLEDEFKRVIAYKLERFSSTVPEIHKSYRQNMLFILEKKSQYLEYMDKKLRMNDPMLQCRKGWGQISMDGKSIELSALEGDQKFIIEDASTKVEAIW